MNYKNLLFILLAVVIVILITISSINKFEENSKKDAIAKSLIEENNEIIKQEFLPKNFMLVNVSLVNESQVMMGAIVLEPPRCDLPDNELLFFVFPQNASLGYSGYGYSKRDTISRWDYKNISDAGIGAAFSSYSFKEGDLSKIIDLDIIIGSCVNPIVKAAKNISILSLGKMFLKDDIISNNWSYIFTNRTANCTDYVLNANYDKKIAMLFNAYEDAIYLTKYKNSDDFNDGIKESFGNNYVISSDKIEYDKICRHPLKWN